MFSVADATSTLATLFTNTGQVLTYVIPITLLGLIALLGLGFGVRHLRKYITGRKF